MMFSFFLYRLWLRLGHWCSRRLCVRSWSLRGRHVASSVAHVFIQSSFHRIQIRSRIRYLIPSTYGSMTNSMRTVIVVLNHGMLVFLFAFGRFGFRLWGLVLSQNVSYTYRFFLLWLLSLICFVGLINLHIFSHILSFLKVSDYQRADSGIVRAFA